MNDLPEPYKNRLKEGSLLLNKETTRILHSPHNKRLWSKSQIQN
jgi:hypothetical protein